MIQWGLCCIFREEPIRFRRAVAAQLAKLSREEQLQRLGEILHANAENLLLALKACVRRKIAAFRINSQLMPLATHPTVGYRLEELPGAETIRAAFGTARRYAAAHALRLSFHPDQFVVLNSPDPAAAENSRRELRHQAFLAELCGATEINLHAGGVYGDKSAALARLQHEIAALPPEIAARLTLENDDRCYTPSDLIPFCQALQIPFVYDVHHHRVNPDAMSVEDATAAAIASWRGRAATPHVHLSSPRLPWNVAGDHRPHADEIDPADFPACWRALDLTVDVEAKAKETAIRNLENALQR